MSVDSVENAGGFSSSCSRRARWAASRWSVVADGCTLPSATLHTRSSAERLPECARPASASAVRSRVRELGAPGADCAVANTPPFAPSEVASSRTLSARSLPRDAIWPSASGTSNIARSSWGSARSAGGESICSNSASAEASPPSSAQEGHDVVSAGEVRVAEQHVEFLDPCQAHFVVGDRWRHAVDVHGEGRLPHVIRHRICGLSTAGSPHRRATERDHHSVPRHTRRAKTHKTTP